MSCINMGIITGLQFPLTGAVTKLFTGGQERALTGPEEMGAALVGGALSGLACVLSDYYDYDYDHDHYYYY